MMELAQICSKLRELLHEVVREDLAEGVLLSGGLDTSIVALVAKRYVTGLKAFTVSLESYDEDLGYAEKVAKSLGLELKIHLFTEDEILEVVPKAARILDSRSKYFPEPVGASVFAPNYIALRFAKNFVNSVYTGDGGDELFFGYSSMVSLGLIMSQDDEFYTPHFKQELQSELLGFLQTYDIAFPIKLGRALGIEVKSPYLAPQIAEYAKGIPLEYKVKSEGERVWGKWILRKAFEDYLPKEIIWREKVPIDSGTGSIKLLPLLE
jgi:asparagine synthase (glutamine-hydrolysing)